MAKIVLSADAPDEAKDFSLGNAEISVPYETDDPVIVANARSHPWLEVEVDATKSVIRYRETSTDPKTDPLSAENPDALIPFDEDAVAEFEATKAESVAPVAVEAGADQDKKGRATAEISTTIAAAEANASKTVDGPTTKGDKS